MTKEELDQLMKISYNPDEVYLTKEERKKYGGFGKFREANLTVDEMRAAISILKDIVMTSNESERNSKYLFKNGLDSAKDIFMTKIKNGENIPKDKVEAFKSKIDNVAPLIEFIIKVEEVIK